MFQVCVSRTELQDSGTLRDLQGQGLGGACRLVVTVWPIEGGQCEVQLEVLLEMYDTHSFTQLLWSSCSATVYTV